MRTSVVLCVALAAALILSGCSSKSDSSSSSTSTASSSSGRASSSGTATVAPNATNHAPVIGSLTANTTAGPAPLKVQFKLNATDADKDPLNYTLTFGDKTANVTGKLTALGTGNATHLFAAAGNYTVKLVVSDGKLSANKTLLVKATAAGLGTPTFVLTGKTKVSGNPNMCEPVPGTCSPGVALGANACTGFNAGQNEVDCVFGPVAATLAGHHYVVSGAAQAVVDFWDSCDAVFGGYVAGGTVGEPLEGTVPAGAGCAILWDYGLDPTGVSLTLTVY